MNQDRQDERLAMVKDQIEKRGVRDPRVLQAMRETPRHLFVPPEVISQAYEDKPLSIGGQQTISQPYIVALMIELLEPQASHRVLEIGVGSGYLAAVLSSLVREVFGVERNKTLLIEAKDRLGKMSLSNIQLKEGDGTLGWKEEAPFDAILVSAGAPKIPPSLFTQLKVGGVLVIPVGNREEQRLIRVLRRSETHFQEKELIAVRFVPLVGAEGWKE